MLDSFKTIQLTTITNTINAVSSLDLLVDHFVLASCDTACSKSVPFSGPCYAHLSINSLDASFFNVSLYAAGDSFYVTDQIISIQVTVSVSANATYTFPSPGREERAYGTEEMAERSDEDRRRELGDKCGGRFVLYTFRRTVALIVSAQHILTSDGPNKSMGYRSGVMKGDDSPEPNIHRF